MNSIEVGIDQRDPIAGLDTRLAGADRRSRAPAARSRTTDSQLARLGPIEQPEPDLRVLGRPLEPGRRGSQSAVGHQQAPDDVHQIADGLDLGLDLGIETDAKPVLDLHRQGQGLERVELEILHQPQLRSQRRP